MFRNSLRYLGLSLVILSLAGSLTTLCAFLYNEQYAAIFFASMSLSLMFIGVFLRRRVTKEIPTQQLAVSFLALNFLIAIPLGALPYILIENTSVIDALFESTSGFTTCGMTVFLDVEAFNKSTILWRSMTEWLGGLGLITIFLSLLRGKALEVFAKVKGLDRDVDVKLSSLIKQMFLVYTVITIIGFLSLMFLGGLNTFDAMNHAMTAVSTGGFSTKNMGVLFFEESPAFNSLAIEITLTTMSILGMTSFILITGLLFRRRVKKVMNTKYKLDFEELKVMFPIILLGTSIIMTLFVTRLGLPVFTALRQAVFHTVTTLSGTGYNAMDLSQWTMGVKIIILLISIMGGSAWSGAGALKLTRVYSFLHTFPKIFKFITRREKVEIDDKTKEDLSYIAIFLTILAIGVIALYPFLSNHSFLDVLYQVEGALGNTGPQILNISKIHVLGKFFFIILMVLGYLEILPISTLIKSIKASVQPKIE